MCFPLFHAQESSRGFFSFLRGGASRRQQEEQQQQQRAVQDQLHKLRARVQEQERELEEKRRTKQEHLSKWDWLEKEYQQKCHTAQCAQQGLEKAEDELRASKELNTLKDQRIKDLESEFEAKKLGTTEVAVQVSSNHSN